MLGLGSFIEESGQNGWLSHYTRIMLIGTNPLYESTKIRAKKKVGWATCRAVLGVSLVTVRSIEECLMGCGWEHIGTFRI